MKKNHWIILAILAFGLFLRAYNIDIAPPGIYTDEAQNGIDALRANETGNYLWFYPDNQGREGFFMNTIALMFKFFGVSVLAFKLPSIIFGTLAILGVYLLAKEIFLRERPALLSAFLLAASFWSINFSRISFRAIMTPFVVSFFLYFFLRGLRTRKLSDFIWSGLFFGWGFHTYIAFRIVPVILACFVVALTVSRKRFWSEYWRAAIAFSLAGLIVILPMLLTYYQHPEYLSSRSAAVSVLSPEVNHGSFIKTFTRTVGLSLAKYNFWGDQNWRHNFPPYPILDPVTGTAFLFGLIVSAWKLIKFTWLRLRRGVRSTEFDVNFLIIFTFFGLLAPEFMTAEGLPHSLRSIGTIPMVFILAGATFDWLMDRTAAIKTLNRRKMAHLALTASLIFVGVFNPLKYFFFWAPTPQAASAFNKDFSDIVKYVKTLPPDEPKLIMTSGNGLERLPIMVFAYGTPVLSFYYPNELDKLPITGPATAIFTREDWDLINTVRSKYPSSEYSRIIYGEGVPSNLYILKIK